MSELQRNQDVERALATWMDGAAPTGAPSRLLEGTFAETMRARQARVYPWHGLRLAGPSGLAPSSLARGLLVLGLLAALVLGLALAGGGSPPVAPTGGATSPLPPSSAPTPSPAASLPASISITADAMVDVPDLFGFEVGDSELLGLGQGQIVRIDLGTGKVTGSVPLGATTDLYNGFGTNEAGIWATDWDNRTLYRVDPKTLKVVAAIPAGFAPKGLLATADGVWVADTHFGTVMRIDQQTNTVAATITVGPTGNSGPNWLGSGLGSIWTDIPNNATVVRIDPVTDLVQATLHTPAGFIGCGGIAVGTNAVWVSGCAESAALGRFDPVTNLPVTVIPLPGYGGPTLIDDAPWESVATGDDNAGLILRIDPATNTIDRVFVPDVPFGGGGGIVVVGASVWVHDEAHRRLLRFPLAAFRA